MPIHRRVDNRVRQQKQELSTIYQNLCGQSGGDLPNQAELTDQQKHHQRISTDIALTILRAARHAMQKPSEPQPIQLSATAKVILKTNAKPGGRYEKFHEGMEALYVVMKARENTLPEVKLTLLKHEAAEEFCEKARSSLTELQARFELIGESPQKSASSIAAGQLTAQFASISLPRPAQQPFAVETTEHADQP